MSWQSRVRKLVDLDIKKEIIPKQTVHVQCINVK